MFFSTVYKLKENLKNEVQKMKANAQITAEEQERLREALNAEDMNDVQIAAFNKKKTSFNAPYSIVFHDSIKTLSRMDLKPNAYKIVLYMFSILQMGNIIINFSQKKIAKDMGLQPSNVSRAFKELFEKKILIKDSENGHVYFNSNIATIGIPKNFNKQTMENLQRSQVETEDFKNSLNLKKHTRSKKINNKEDNIKEFPKRYQQTHEENLNLDLTGDLNFDDDNLIF